MRCSSRTPRLLPTRWSKLVYVVGDDNVVKGVPVKLGPIVDGLRVVQNGLSPTDKIIINGIANPMVRAGAKVTPASGEIKAVLAKN